MMDLDKYIDPYINQEKKITPSPLLHSTIMARLNTENTSRSVILWRSVAVAASIAAVVAFGLLIGSSYNHSPKADNYITVNDSQIENFLMLIDYVEE